MTNLSESALLRHNMLNRGDKIVVGLSGGADSVALTHSLKELGCKLVACHINHCLRGEESDRDEAFVKGFCKELSIPVKVVTADVLGYADEHGMTVEEAGRKIRYAAFEETRKEFNAQKIATAHTLSDNLETLLLNLTRGSGLNGLCGIPPVRGNIIRPLIYSTRAEVEEYCLQNNLSFVTDSTNLNSDYTRNKIRNKIIPILKEINPSVEQAAARTADILRDDSRFLDKIAGELKPVGENSIYDISMLKEAESPVIARVMSLILKERGLNVSYDTISLLCRAVTLGKGKCTVSGANTAEVKNDKLYFNLKEPVPYFEKELTLGEIEIGEIKLKVSKIENKNFEKFKKVYKNLLYTAVNSDKIVGRLFVRQRLAGDKIEFYGRNGTHSLKKLFIDKKLLPYEKSIVPVIADDIGIVAVVGYGVSKRAAIDETARNAILIEDLTTREDENYVNE